MFSIYPELNQIPPSYPNTTQLEFPSKLNPPKIPSGEQRNTLPHQNPFGTYNGRWVMPSKRNALCSSSSKYTHSVHWIRMEWTGLFNARVWLTWSETVMNVWRWDLAWKSCRVVRDGLEWGVIIGLTLRTGVFLVGLNYCCRVFFVIENIMMFVDFMMFNALYFVLL